MFEDLCFQSLPILRVLGWKGRFALVAGVAAAWISFAPEAVSEASKTTINLVQSFQEKQ